MAADHPAAEIKSVPVAGDGVVERVKLGVVSPRSNPLAKCDRILFVFVEQRGDDFFVAGHHARDFDVRRRGRDVARRLDRRDRGRLAGAAGARLVPDVPRWFRAQRIWPSPC